MEYLQGLTKADIEQLSKDLELWSKGAPPLGLRMQMDFPEEIFQAVTKLADKRSPSIFKALIGLASKGFRDRLAAK
jgi:hypothetical protein